MRCCSELYYVLLTREHAALRTQTLQKRFNYSCLERLSVGELIAGLASEAQRWERVGEPPETVEAALTQCPHLLELQG